MQVCPMQVISVPACHTLSITKSGHNAAIVLSGSNTLQKRALFPNEGTTFCLTPEAYQGLFHKNVNYRFAALQYKPVS